MAFPPPGFPSITGVVVQISTRNSVSPDSGCSFKSRGDIFSFQWVLLLFCIFSLVDSSIFAAFIHLIMFHVTLPTSCEFLVFFIFHSCCFCSNWRLAFMVTWEEKRSGILGMVGVCGCFFNPCFISPFIQSSAFLWFCSTCYVFLPRCGVLRWIKTRSRVLLFYFHVIVTYFSILFYFWGGVCVCC